jgi:hypothetical protein
MRMMVLMAALAIGGLSAVEIPAHAGCGGGGGSRGGYGGGHTFARSYGAGGSCCSGMSMSGMPMSGSNMAGMSMAAPAAPAPAPAADMSGMNMGATAAPAPAGNVAASAARYTCPMHPNVVSSGPARCPYCSMALVRK